MTDGGLVISCTHIRNHMDYITPVRNCPQLDCSPTKSYNSGAPACTMTSDAVHLSTSTVALILLGLPFSATL
jgi:hypothetical protein